MKTTKKPGKKRFLRFFSYILLLALIVLTYTILLSDLDKNALLHALDGAHVGVLGIGLLCVLGYVFFEGCAIRTLCASLGVKFGYFAAFRYACVELFFSAATPSSTGGQPLMIYYMCREGAPVTVAGTAVLINTIAYALTTFLFGLFAVLLEADEVFAMRPAFVVAVILGCTVCLVLIAGCLMCLFWSSLVRKVAIGVVRFLTFIRLVRRREKCIAWIEEHLVEFRAGADHVRRHPLVFLRALAENCGQRICYLVVSYCVYRSFGLSGISVIPIMLLQMIMTIPAYSVPLPGGVGITELMFLELYDFIYLSEERCTAAMMLTRGLNHYLCVLLCGVVVIATHIYSGKKAALAAATVPCDAETSLEG